MYLDSWLLCKRPFWRAGPTCGVQWHIQTPFYHLSFSSRRSTRRSWRLVVGVNCLPGNNGPLFLVHFVKAWISFNIKKPSPLEKSKQKLSSKLTWQWKSPSLKWQRDVHSWLCLSICHVNLEGGIFLWHETCGKFWYLVLATHLKSSCQNGNLPNQGWLWTYLKPILLISPLWRKPPLRNCSHGNLICEQFTWRPQKFMHLGWGEQSLCHYYKRPKSCKSYSLRLFLSTGLM